MKVDWDDYSQYFWENNPVMFQENHQPEMEVLIGTSSIDGGHPIANQYFSQPL